jgi:hypothetical protein
MAVTAEALMNSLAGGDSGPSNDRSGIPAVEPGSGDGAPGESAAAPAADAPPADPTNTSSPPAEGVKPTAEQLYQNAQAAIRETRAENKTLKQQLQELTAKIESLAKPAPPAQPEPEAPDFLADPKAYVDDTRKQLKELTEKLDTKEKEQTEAQKQQEAAQEKWTKIVTAEAEFAATTPDYNDALQHIRKVTSAQIKLQFPQATDEQIAKHIQQQEFQGAAQIVADGRNPSQVYYEYAKLIGYSPKAPPPPAVNGAPKPDKDAVRTMGSGGAGDSVTDEPAGDAPLGGLLAAAQTEHRAQFKRRK